MARGPVLRGVTLISPSSITGYSLALARRMLFGTASIKIVKITMVKSSAARHNIFFYPKLVGS